MKIARFHIDGSVKLGVVEGQAIASLTDRIAGLGDDMISLIRNWDRYKDEAARLTGQADYALDSVTFLAPVPRPGKIFGIGFNYADHIAETGAVRPEVQTWFTKAVTSVADPYGEIELPQVSTALDYEAELVAVVGAGGRRITEADAPAAIFGYCAGNDVSVRDWQMKTTQHMIGKSFDTHAPYGPWIVTADSIDPHSLDIRCFVNGEKRQDSNTKHLIFNSYAQVSHLSQAMTLEPGDLLFTGTPAGVGGAMKPQRFLRDGDVVRVEVEGIGAIENRVAPER